MMRAFETNSQSPCCAAPFPRVELVDLLTMDELVDLMLLLSSDLTTARLKDKEVALLMMNSKPEATTNNNSKKTSWDPKLFG